MTFVEEDQASLTIVDHPLVAHKLSILRDKNTPSPVFREVAREIAMLLAYEATRDLDIRYEPLETPMEAMDAPMLATKAITFATVLRAGNALLEGMLNLVPFARVAHVGLYRDAKTFEAIEYYFNAPKDLDAGPVIVLDPMLATANTLTAAIAHLKKQGAKDIRCVCLLAAPEGLNKLQAEHPDVPIIIAALDDGLDEKGYILPGLGDAGDRAFGTV
jgi:uracil phosphoribosyltransferase